MLKDRFLKLRGSLRLNLLLSSILTLLLIICCAVFAVKGRIVIAVIFAVLTILFVIAFNIWFDRYILKPINSLIYTAQRISSGSYGTQTQKHSDNEIGRLTDALNDISSKIAASDKTTSEFISQISHELRTPLTAIMGWSETLQYDPAIEGDSLRGVKIIYKESERLTGMVSDLLEFTRIQDGRFNLRIELVDITAELEDSLFTYGSLMREAGIDIVYTQPDDDIPLISGDPERLKQVFLNLLDNAAKHGGDGKKVDVSLTLEGNCVAIGMRDYGPGIPAAELPHVTEKFYKGSSKNRGSGIGLAVCNEIITRHGGVLTISNADGGGCFVKITLPISES